MAVWKKILIGVVLVLVAATGKFIMKTVLEKVNTPDYASLEYLQKEADTVNKELPKMIDDNVRFSKVVVSEKRMEFQYTLVNIEWSEDVVAEFANTRGEMLKETKETLCTDHDVQPALKAGVTFVYSYLDKAGKNIESVPFDQSVCLSPQS